MPRNRDDTMAQLNTKKTKERKTVGFPRLVLESVPELWVVRMLASVLVAALLFVVRNVISAMLGVRIRALTTANLKTFLLSWQAPVVIAITIAAAFLVIALDLFVQVQISGDILRGEKAYFFPTLKRAFLNIRKFLNPAGIVLLIYVLFGAPLVGIGFGVEATEHFQLPSFIMSVIMNKPLFLFLYVAGCVALVLFGLLYMFSIHGVLLSGKTPKEAKKYSTHLLKKNWKKMILPMALVLVSLFLIRAGVSYLLHEVIPDTLASQEETLPEGHADLDFVDDLENGFVDMTEEEADVLVYRIEASTVVIVGGYVESTIILLLTSFFMLYFTKLYLQFDHAETADDRMQWLARPKSPVFFGKLIGMILFSVIIVVISFGLAFSLNLVMRDYNVPIIAHRGGGNLASENSVEGVRAAVRYGCYGTETDIQRTKDGYYIINHDDTFKRMAGVNKAAQNMTLEEVKALKVRDTTGKNGVVSISTLEEFLDSGEDSIHYFLELKGATADRKMADDVVRIVKEKGMEEDVTIISLKYDLIDYVEQTYPKMDTGVLFFLGTGNMQNLNCDMLIVEQGMASDAIYQMAHDAGKKIVVWTLNTHDALYDFLDENVDGVITDTVELAETVKKELEKRSELTLIKDRVKNVWN